MRSLLMVVVSNIRRRKTQMLLVGTTLAAAALLFTLSLGSLRSLDAPFQKSFEQLQGTQFHFFVNGNVYDVAKVSQWWQGQQGVQGVHVIPTVAQLFEFAYLTHQGAGAQPGRTEVERSLWISEYSDDSPLDRLRILHGAQARHPGPGEVWLPSSLAQVYGAHVGDLLELPTQAGFAELKVSAIVIDSVFSASMNFYPMRVWLGPGQLSWYFPVSALKDVMIGVRTTEGADRGALWSAFNDSLGGAFNGASYSLEMVESQFSSTLQLISFAILIVSFLSLAMAFFMISSTIQGSVLADYRQIGILKSMGYTPGNVVASYSLQFLLVAFAFLPLGLIGGFSCLQILNQQFIESLGFVAESEGFWPLAMLTLTTIPTLVAAIAGLAGWGAGRIKAVDAIRIGEVSPTPSRSPFPLNRVTRMPLVLMLALHGMFIRKRRLVINVLTVALSSFVFVFCLNLLAFFEYKTSDAVFWGTPNTEISLVHGSKRYTVDRAELISALETDKRIDYFVMVDAPNITLPSSPSHQPEILSGQVVDGDMDLLGFWNLEGRNPIAPDEVALAINTVRERGLRVGDQVELVVGGRQLSYRLCGVYQLISNMGKGFRITEAGYRRGDSGHVSEIALIHPADPHQTKAIIESYQKKFGEGVTVTDSTGGFGEAIRAQAAGLAQPISIVMLLFALVALVMISNSTTMELHEKRKEFGIYKTLGMTPGRIRATMATQTVLASLGGILLGTVVELALQGTLMGQIMSGLGIVRVDLIVAVVPLSVILPLFLMFCVGSSWLASRPARTIHARTLIVE